MERRPRHACIRRKNICLSYNLWHWPPLRPSPSCSTSVHGSTVCAQIITWSGTARLSPPVAIRQPGQPYTESFYLFLLLLELDGTYSRHRFWHHKWPSKRIRDATWKCRGLTPHGKFCLYWVLSWCGLHLSRFIILDIKTEETLKYLLTIFFKTIKLMIWKHKWQMTYFI